MASLTDRNQLVAWSIACSLLVAVAGLLVLIGWPTGLDWLVRLRPDYAAMVPSTAFSFLVLGLGVWFAHRTVGNRYGIIAVSALAGMVVGAVAIADLIVLLSGDSAGIDSLVFGLSLPGDAMSYATAICFALAAYCLAALSVPRLMVRPAFTASATLGLLLALVAVAGYLFDTAALYAFFVFTAMALHTAVVFVLLFAAILLSRPDLSWVGTLLGVGSGSKGAQRLFPIVIAGPIVLGFIALKLTEAGFFDANFRLALLAIITTASIAAAVLRNAHIENATERRLLATVHELEVAHADKDLLLREVYHRVKNNLQQINAMLRIESRRIDDPKVTEAFRYMADRIQAIGMVHQLLIAAPRPSEVDLGDFIPDLCKSIANGNDLERRGITLKSSAIPQTAHLDVAISVGLLINELVANCIEHAFPDNQPGTVEVIFGKSSDDQFELTVSDSGPRDPGAPAAPGTGSVIIRSLVGQLGGTLTTDVGNGTVIRVSMPADFYERGRYE